MYSKKYLVYIWKLQCKNNYKLSLTYFKKIFLLILNNTAKNIVVLTKSPLKLLQLSIYKLLTKITLTRTHQ